ncbi:hypothetical protein D3C80_1741770 [compost metagenome]
MIVDRQLPKSAQQIGLVLGQVAQRCRGAHTAEHIERVHALGGQCCEVIGAGRALTALVLTLGIGLDPTDVTKHPLGHAQPFALFAQSRTESIHLTFLLCP